VVSDALIFGAGLGAGLLLQWGVYLLVRRPHILAMPNERSSHTQPTPTMGGAALVLVVLAYLVHLAGLEPRLGWGLFTALAVMGLVGLWDDLRGLSARFRLLVHFAASALVIWCLQPDLSWWLAAAVLVALVWFTNLYNFMDGIDGYAAVQCLVFCIGVQVVAGGLPGWQGQLVWLMSGAALAFLAFNWPPAKVFMGDVGSGFVGLLIGALTLYLWHTQNVPLVASLILLAVFWFDATYTLCVRMVTKQEFTQAHRLHLYQHVSIRRGHLWTTGAFLIYAILWLLPLAYFAQVFMAAPLVQAAALCAAILPLAVLCYRHGAGLTQPE
jgi:Fuc2NAc and GlcNAc transferase